MLQAYLAHGWPNDSFPVNWSIPVIHPAVEAHYPLRHWSDVAAYGVEHNVLVPFSSPPSAPPTALVRWALISFNKRIIGFFESDLQSRRIDDLPENTFDITYERNGVLSCNHYHFLIESLPLDWLVAFKRVRWPSVALVLASYDGISDCLLPQDRAHTAKAIIARSLAPKIREPPLFKFKPHQLKPPFLVDPPEFRERKRF